MSSFLQVSGISWVEFCLCCLQTMSGKNSSQHPDLTARSSPDHSIRVGIQYKKGKFCCVRPVTLVWLCLANRFFRSSTHIRVVLEFHEKYLTSSRKFLIQSPHGAFVTNLFTSVSVSQPNVDTNSHYLLNIIEFAVFIRLFVSSACIIFMVAQSV